MNVNQLKDKHTKRKTSVLYKINIDKRLFTDLKEKSPIHAEGSGLKNKQQKMIINMINT